MELPSHLPRDTGDDLLPRAMQLDIGPYVNDQKSDGTYPQFGVIVINDARCNPPFKIADAYSGVDFTDYPRIVSAVIRTLFDRVIDE